MFTKPSRTEEQQEGLRWGIASGETEAQKGRNKAPLLRIPSRGAAGTARVRHPAGHEIRATRTKRQCPRPGTVGTGTP